MGGVREVGRFDGPGGPKVLRVLKFDSGFAAEGCGIAFGHACGVRIQRVHKVQRVQRVQRGWHRRFAAMGFMLWRSCIGPPSQPKLALSLPIKGPSFCRLTVFGGSAAKGSENQTTGLRPLEMHPYPRLRRYFPRRGKFSCRSAFELISTLKHSVAKTSPSGGGAVGRRGAFLLWSPCRGSPSRAKFVLSLHTKGPSYESPGRCRAVGLFSSGRSPVVWFSLHCCHKLKLTPLPSTHSAP